MFVFENFNFNSCHHLNDRNCLHDKQNIHMPRLKMTWLTKESNNNNKNLHQYLNKKNLKKKTL